MGEAPALRQLWAEVQTAYGDRVSFLGIMGDKRHCPGKSDHCNGNALDIGTGSDDNLAWHIAEIVLNDRRCTYIIHDGRGRKASWRGGAWFSSTGHDTHIHVSIDGGLRNETHSWGVVAEVPPPPPKEIPPMASSIVYREELHHFWVNLLGQLKHVYFNRDRGWHNETLGVDCDPDDEPAVVIYPQAGVKGAFEEVHVTVRKQNGALFHWFFDGRAHRQETFS